MKSLLTFCYKIIKTFFNITYINLYFFFSKILNKKTVIFYHPELTIKNINYQFLYKIKNYDYKKKISFFYCNRNFCSKEKKEYYLPYKGLKFIFFCDFFLNNYISDFFPKNSKNIYLHHAIYDTPLTNYESYPVLKKRIFNYNYIFLCAQKTSEVFKKLLGNFKKIQFYYIGYYKKQKFNIKRKKNFTILLAPTGSRSFPKLSIYKNNKLEFLIETLIKKNYKVIFRPHPADLKKYNFLKKFNKFKNKKFLLDKNNNYRKSFIESDLLITDFSDIAYSFSLLTLKPSLFFSANSNYLKKTNFYKYSYIKDIDKIGLSFKKIQNLNQKILFTQKNIKIIERKIKNLKKEMNFNFNSKNKIIEFFYNN